MDDGENKILKSLAFMMGMLLVMSAIWMLRPSPGQGGVQPASFSVRAAPSSELRLPEGVFLASANIRPGKGESGSLLVQNQTGSDIRLSPTLRPSSTYLNGLLQIKISQGARILSRGTLQETSLGSDRPLMLPASSSVRISLRAWLPFSVETGYEGQKVQALLSLEKSPR